MKILILGGTGTLGREIIEALSLKDDQITVFSRDELKQSQMREQFLGKRNLRFVLGDIRDRASLDRAMIGIEAVYHLAALKHVDIIEENPEEAVKTNILGTIYAADSAIAAGVKYFAFSSTDKAVDPINVYGMTKGISEKLLLEKNQTQSTTLFSVYRWGNVLGSRGSVIPKFVKSLTETGSVFLTHEDMSRFWIRGQDAAGFMIRTLTQPSLQAKIPPLKSASVKSVVKSICRIQGLKDPTFEVIGIRRGEKIHESLTSSHELFHLNSRDHNEFSNDELDQLLAPVLGEIN